MLYRFLKFVARLLVPLLFQIEVSGNSNLTNHDEAVIICSNHICWFDPIWIAHIYPRRIRFMAKQELFSNRISAFLLSRLGAFPVRRGTADRKAIRTALGVLRQRQVLGIFPEGTRRRAGLGQAHHGAAYLALKTGTVVLPVSITGQLSFRAKIRIVFGKPLHFETQARVTNEELQVASKKIMDAIAVGLGEVS